jgi:hypothetical protein
MLVMIEAPSILHKRFQVADVEPATAPLETVSSAEFLNKLAQSAVLVNPTPAIRAVAAADFHPLVAAAAKAFKQHYHRIISPDMISNKLLPIDLVCRTTRRPSSGI